MPEAYLRARRINNPDRYGFSTLSSDLDPFLGNGADKLPFNFCSPPRANYANQTVSAVIWVGYKLFFSL